MADAPIDEHDSPRRFRPRRVLFGALGFVAIATGLYFVSPWLLPLRIVEGPLVQGASQTECTLIWYTSRPATTELRIVVDGAERTIPVESLWRRNRARITGLSPGQTCRYLIRAEQRVLAESSLRSAKPAGESFSFLVFGDSGRASREQYALASHMLDARPDFLVHTGDLVYSSGERGDYSEKFFAPYRELLQTVSFWPSLGNHDVAKESRGDAYREVFELPLNGPSGLTPENNYWFDYAAARFVIIDSNLDEERLKADVAPWLKKVLNDSAPLWRFVVFHHPPYSIGKHGDDVRIQNTLVPAIEAAGVDVVFCGHDHLYERTQPLHGGRIAAAGEHGVVYIVTGAGGAALYEAKPPEQRPDYYVAVEDRRHSFTNVIVNGRTLLLRQIGLDGVVIDQAELIKGEPAAQ